MYVSDHNEQADHGQMFKDYISVQVNGIIGPDGKFKAEIQDCHYEILDEAS